MSRQVLTSGKPPIVWSTIEEAFTKINANFTELYASVGLTGSIGFDALETHLIPKDNDTYDLGSATKKWGTLYLSKGLRLGGALISNEGLTIELPSGSTVAGQLIIDPDKSFFKEVSVNNTSSIVADQFNDVFNINAGVGIDVTLTSASDTITIDNAGVTQITAGLGIDINTSTGNVTITNDGVRTITAGDGIEVVDSSATGDLTIHNNGVLYMQAGTGITLSNSGQPDMDGKIIITNNAPAGNAYRTIAVAGEANLPAPNLAATLTLIEGAGMNITTALASGALNNRVTFENTGVLSLTAGNGVTLSSSTGNITISVGSGDLKGSLFGDDSTLLVDGTGSRIVGPVQTTSLRTSESAIALGGGAGATSQGILAVAVGLNAGGTSQGNYGIAIGNGSGETAQGSSSVAIGRTAGATNQGANAIAIGYLAGQTNQYANSIIINASGVAVNNTSVTGLFISPVRNATGTGNPVTYDPTTKELVYSVGFDGDITGSVYSDDSTVLVDGAGGKILGPVQTTTVEASSYMQTGVYADLTAIASAIPVPSKGMIVFDDGTNQFRGYDGASWVALN